MVAYHSPSHRSFMDTGINKILGPLLSRIGIVSDLALETVAPSAGRNVSAACGPYYCGRYCTVTLSCNSGNGHPKGQLVYSYATDPNCQFGRCNDLSGSCCV